MKNLFLALLLLMSTAPALAADEAPGFWSEIAAGIGHTWAMDYLACGSAPCAPEGTQLFGEKMIYGSGPSGGSDGFLSQITGLFTNIIIALEAAIAVIFLGHMILAPASAGLSGLNPMQKFNIKTPAILVFVILMLVPIPGGTVGQWLYIRTIVIGSNAGDVVWKFTVNLLQFKNIEVAGSGKDLLGTINQNAPGYIHNLLCAETMKNARWDTADPDLIHSVCGSPRITADMSSATTAGAQRVQAVCYETAYMTHLLNKSVVLPGKDGKKLPFVPIKINEQSIASAWPQFLQDAATCIYANALKTDTAHQENMIAPDSAADAPWINGWASAASGSSVKELANKKIVIAFNAAAANPLDWSGWLEDGNGIRTETKRQILDNIAEFNTALSSDVAKNGYVVAAQKIAGDVGCEVGSQCAQNAGGTMAASAAGISGYFAKNAANLSRVGSEMAGVAKNAALKASDTLAKKAIAPVAVFLSMSADLPTVALAAAAALWIFRVALWFLMVPLVLIVYAIPGGRNIAPWKIPLGLALTPVLIVLVYVVGTIVSGVGQDLAGMLLFNEYGAGGFFANSLAILSDFASLEIFVKPILYVAVVFLLYVTIAGSMLYLPAKILSVLGLSGTDDGIDQQMTKGSMTRLPV